MNKFKTYLLTTLLLLGVMAVEAKVVLPTLLSDNAVLQRNANVKLWGSATPNTKVTATPSWDNTTHSTIADTFGNWSIEVQTPDAGEGYSIEFSDGESTTINNILLGEVWLCSGQSNMEMPVRGFKGQPVEGSAGVILKAKASTPIRYYKVETVTSNSCINHTKGTWQEHTPKVVAGFSATAYFFAQYIQEVLGVPVGIIDSSWGGSPIEAWMSPEWLTEAGDYDLQHLAAEEPVAGAYKKPCCIYNAMIYPLFNYQIKGLLWYQGESNRHRPKEYLKLFPSFIKGLRQGFDSGDFPVYLAEIAPHGYKTNRYNAVELREIMGQLPSIVNNCGMISLLDVGERDHIHPRKKQQVGQRFAFLALGDTYGVQGIEYRTPTYREITTLDANDKYPKRIAVTFDHAETGIHFLADKESVLFEIAGEDRKFYPARVLHQTSKFIEHQLEVWADEVPNPVAIRYGYDAFVEGDIFSLYGLPVPSFRSDNWPLE